MVSLLAVSSVAYVTVLRSQALAVDQALNQAMTQVQADGDFDRDHDHDIGRPAASIRAAVLTTDGLWVSADTPAGLPDRAVLDQVLQNGRTDRRTVRVVSGRYALLTERRGGQAVQVMYSLFGQHQERERILGALSLAGGVGLVLSSLLGAWLARRAMRPMSEALALQRRFVADAGHELRTPLTLLSTRAQLLRRRLAAQLASSGATPPIPGQTQILDGLDVLDGNYALDGLDGLVADSRILAEILEELLLAADTRTPPPDQLVDLTALVADAVAAAQATARQKSLALTFHSDAAPAWMTGTSAALTRVVMALIDNALSHASTWVNVDVTRAKKAISVRVTDDGPGIADAVLPTMFERFASDRQTSGEGTGQRRYGLGLSLVNEIVTRYGGTVTAANQSPPEQGACLTVTLPVREPAPPGKPAPAQHHRRHGSQQPPDKVGADSAARVTDRPPAPLVRGPMSPIPTSRARYCAAAAPSCCSNTTPQT